MSRQNHKGNKNDEIPDIKININAIHMRTDIPNCMTVKEIQQATTKDYHLQHLRAHIIKAWPESRNEVPQEIRLYWTFSDDMAVIDGIILKGR